MEARWMKRSGGMWGSAWIAALAAACATLAVTVGCEPSWPRARVGTTGPDAAASGDGGAAGRAAADGAGQPLPCRPVRTGELVINEVVLRPGGLDLDHDGASNGHDEVVEVVSRADEAVHLLGASLWWRGERRGGVLSSPCLAPRTSAVVAFEGGGDLKLPSGAALLLLDRTLRLSDKGGKMELRGAKGVVLDAVTVPMAVTPDAPAVWARQRDADWQAPLISHNEVPGATRPASVGRCASGAPYPCCLAWLDSREEAGRLSEMRGQ